MDVSNTDLPGVRVFEPDVFVDDRGSFMELWNARDYGKRGLNVTFVQDNLSRSCEGVLRGLHFQNPRPQAKLISVLKGAVYDVVVDVRAESDTFGEWHGTVLSADNARQLFVPEGYAHGFVATTDEVLFHYKCTDFYHPEADQTVRWNDPRIGIDWPVEDPVLSDKDAGAPLLDEMPREALTFDATR